jgi:ABC-type Fe3+ transport system substrate-binding protein
MGKTLKLTWLGKLVLVVLAFAALYGIYAVVGPRLGLPTLSDRHTGGATSDPAQTAVPGTASNAPTPNTAAQGSAGPPVAIGIAYGTEKERWLKEALAAWQQTPEGANMTVNLIPMGSVEGAQAILAGDKRLTVWSPAGTLYTPVFEQEWQLRNSNSPFTRVEKLALSPIVFVMWEERYQAFKAKYGEVNFKTLGQALAEPGGWATIANKPEWGVFKLGHTNPNQSNSGLAALVLMAYDYHDKNRDLTMADILDVGFQDWMQRLEHGVSGMSNSTGNMMRDMVLKGPSSYDALVVYEDVAIDYLANAEGRWGQLHVVYPPRNLWNDNPYYILNAPWVTPEQRDAAGKFLDFLLSEPIQRLALPHGFRPGDPSVAIRTTDSPFERLAKYGLQVDLATIVDTPPADVTTNLLASWQRAQGAR